MIQYLVGVPGAGKTYFAVDKIFLFVKEKKYENIYTNIDKFNFSFSPILSPLIWDIFYNNVSELYYIYKDKDTNDDDLIDKLKEMNYFNSFFVIDEAHNFFDNLDPVLVWLFSYHRHLFIDFLLITQNLALVDSKYKKFAEFFIRAVPTSLNLFNHKFTYKKFIDSRLSQKSYVGKEQIKKDKIIFDLYHSGDIVNAPNIIKKYLVYFFIGCIFVFFLFSVVIKIMKGDVTNEVNKKNSVTNKVSLSGDKSSIFKRTDRQISKIVNDDSITDNFYFLSINCFNKICVFDKYRFPLDLFTKLIKTSNSQLLKLDYKNKNYVVVYILASDKLVSYFKGNDNEKDTSVSDNSSISTFSK